MPKIKDNALLTAMQRLCVQDGYGWEDVAVMMRKRGIQMSNGYVKSVWLQVVVRQAAA